MKKVRKAGDGIREILAAGKFPAFRKESTDSYVVDLQMPRGWGQNATKDGKGFAKHYNAKGQPIYRNNHEALEAVAKANDHGDPVHAIHSRDI